MTGLMFRLALVAIVSIFILAIAAGVREENEWQAFAREHGCRVVGKKEAKVLQGPQTVVDPARTVYLCDDGVTYER